MSITLKTRNPILISAHWGQKQDGPLWYLKDGPATYTQLIGLTHVRINTTVGFQFVVGPLMLTIAKTN